MPRTPSEEALLAAIMTALAPLDRLAHNSLAFRLLRIVESVHEPEVIEGSARLSELSVTFDLHVPTPTGSTVSELRLCFRRRSPSALVRAARNIVGAIPPARVLVLRPDGYRLTNLRNLDAKRFVPSGRPRLARYKASSITNLSSTSTPTSRSWTTRPTSRPPSRGPSERRRRHRAGPSP